MTIPPRFLDEIRSRLTLSEIIGRRVSLTRAGREFKACCPFHREKTPSFTVNDDKQFYHCFGCGAHGDVLNFMMQHDNLSFPDAVELLAAEAGLQVPKQTPQEVERSRQEKSLYSLMGEAARWFAGRLYDPRHADALQYLRERGLSEETIRAFHLGFAPADGQALRSYLRAQGYSDTQMIETGLLKKSNKGREPYIFFRERVMFPVIDRRGRVVAFGGRILPEHLRAPERGDFRAPKYINTSDTPLFNKSEILYGEPHARQAAADGHSLLVVEGYLDVIACVQAGFRGAVAPMGTALTEGQIGTLWKMIPGDEKVPVLCFDGDSAGRRAAARACVRILPMLQPGRSVRFSFLPDGEDPDSLIRSGGYDSLRKILQGAIPLFDFIWASHTAGRRFETPEARAGVVQALNNAVREIADREVQRHYQELIRKRVSETFFSRPPLRSGGGYTEGRVPERPAQGLRPQRPATGEKHVFPRLLIAAVLNYPDIYETVGEHFGHLETHNEGQAVLRRRIIFHLEHEPDLDRIALHSHLKHDGLAQEMDDILCQSVYVHGSFARPGHDSGHVSGKWLELWDMIQGRSMEAEIKSGWKNAFRASSAEEEDRLRSMVLDKNGGLN